MKNENQNYTFGTLADILSDQLSAIQSTIQLCAFAAEARRVLTDIDIFLTLHPSVEKTFYERVEAHNEWTCHEDTLPLVLKNVANQVKAAHDLLNSPEVHRDINNP